MPRRTDGSGGSERPARGRRADGGRASRVGGGDAQLSVAQLPVEEEPVVGPEVIAEVLSLRPDDLVGGDRRNDVDAVRHTERVGPLPQEVRQP